MTAKIIPLPKRWRGGINEEMAADLGAEVHTSDGSDGMWPGMKMVVAPASEPRQSDGIDALWPAVVKVDRTPQPFWRNGVPGSAPHPAIWPYPDSEETKD